MPPPWRKKQKKGKHIVSFWKKSIALWCFLFMLAFGACGKAYWPGPPSTWKQSTELKHNTQAPKQVRTKRAVVGNGSSEAYYNYFL